MCVCVCVSGCKVLLHLLVVHPGKRPSRGSPVRATYGGGSEPPGRYGSHEGLSGTLNTGRLTEFKVNTQDLNGGPGGRWMQ